jgi:L-malate glycosyltransferase
MPNKPLTIMYLIDTFISPPGSSFIGGAEKQLYLLTSSLDPEKFRPVIIQLSPKPSTAVPTGKMGTLELFHFPIRRIYGWSGLNQIWRLLNLARRKNVDVVHTFFEKSEVIGWLIGRLAGIPVWITSRRDLGFKRKDIYNRVFRLSARSCDKCIANCHAVKEAVMEQGVLPEEKIEVIYNGIDFSPDSRDPDGISLRKELGIRNGTPLVGMIANFNFEIKGHQYFLRAVKNVLEILPKAKFVLVGDGPLRNKYETEARALGLESNLVFLGKRGDGPSIISTLDVSVLSSTSEGFSNVILESMAAGKPIVATNVGGNAELVRDGETGYLVPPGDPRAMANGIIKLLRNPGKAVEMGIAGRKMVEERFSTEAMAKSYERLYVSSITGNRDDRGRGKSLEASWKGNRPC